MLMMEIKKNLGWLIMIEAVLNLTHHVKRYGNWASSGNCEETVEKILTIGWERMLDPQFNYFLLGEETKAVAYLWISSFFCASLITLHLLGLLLPCPSLDQTLAPFSVTREKSESSRSKMANCSSDLPYMHDEFVELLWANGPVTSNNPRKIKDNPYRKIGHFKAMEPKSNNLHFSGLRAHDDDIVPWLNYPIEDEDPLRNDYCSDFLDDYCIHSQNNTVPTIKSYFSDHAVKDTHTVAQGRASDDSRVKGSQLFQLLASTKSSEIDVTIGNSSKTQKENGGIGVLNFSHFSRPAALARAHLQCFESNKKASFAMGSDPMASSVIESAGGVKSGLVVQDQSSAVQSDGDTRSSPKANNHNNTNTSRGLSEAVARDESEKGNEAVVASSSACSGSSAWEKGKHLEGEESTYQSEDLEGESEDLKKPSTIQAKSKKRSRAAEVHNQSERRRRDRINERMRALQELIPNCNKTDKASMLDEAIEYLKSLQMQVQIMSMGSGLCMPPMMMQHMGASMPPFAPMSVGMGMGMGMGIGLNCGMGLYDMNGSPRCSFIQVPPIQGAHFPYPSITGSPRPNGLQFFGFPRPMPYRPPPTSLVDTKSSPGVYTKSENHHQQSKNAEKTERSDSGDFKS